jgi:hypothetical protein
LGQHGGARRNAGRRKNASLPLTSGLAKELFEDQGVAANAEKKIEARLSTRERWQRLRDSKDEQLAFRVEQYIWDRHEGKPTIRVESGPEKPPAEVEFGNLSMPTQARPGAAGKPN